MTVIIAPNIKRQKAMINMNGDEVVPYTNQVIKSANEGNYIPTQAEREALQRKSVEGSIDEVMEQILPDINNTSEVRSDNPVVIQQQIEAAEKHLAFLKELKKKKIEDMKKQLEMLESQ